MFRSLTVHHQGVRLYLVKATELLCTDMLPDDDLLKIETCRSTFK